METKAVGQVISYKTREEPKDVRIEIGKFYTLSDGSGTKDVKIIGIRKLDEQVIIYYKYQVSNGKIMDWGGTWRENQCTLDTFKAQLLEYGKL